MSTFILKKKEKKTTKLNFCNEIQGSETSKHHLRHNISTCKFMVQYALLLEDYELNQG